MRILHTSDWHLGIFLHNMPLLAEQEHFISQLIQIVQDKKIDAVVVAGDIFDSSVSNNDAISLYNKAVTTICGEFKTPMIIIAGNHDGAARLASCRDLLKNSGLYITGKLTKPIQPLVFDNVAFYAIPYFNIDEVRALYPDKEIKTYEKAMQTVCDNIRENVDKSKTNIAIAHAFISGAELSDSDRSAMVGSVNMVSKDVFDGFTYVALGHLHRPQNTDDMIRYSGSPLKYSFSEVNHNKNMTIIDTENMGISTNDIVPLTNMQVLKGEYDTLLNNAIHSNDFIKIEITDRYIGLETLDTFRNFYPNLLSISGKSAISDNEQITLTIDEIETLSPAELLRKFYLETLGASTTDEQIELFTTALDEVSKEDILT